MTLIRTPSHPGEVLAELYHGSLGLSAIELALRLHVPRARVDRLVKADTALTDGGYGAATLDLLRQHPGVLN